MKIHLFPAGAALMLKKLILPILCILFAPLSAQAADAGTIIGTIVAVEGGATVEIADKAGTKLDAAPNMPVRAGDRITTDKNAARAMILMIDDTQFTLGDDTQFSVSEFDFRGDQQNGGGGLARYEIAHGTFLYMGGMIPQSKRPDVSIKFPYGVISERAPATRTAIWGGIVRDEFNEAYGVYVDQGKATIETGRGRMMVKKGHGVRLGGSTNLIHRAAPWQQGDVDEARMRVNLAERDSMRMRIADIKENNPALVQEHRSLMMQKAADLPRLKQTTRGQAHRQYATQRSGTPAAPSATPQPSTLADPWSPDQTIAPIEEPIIEPLTESLTESMPAMPPAAINDAPRGPEPAEQATPQAAPQSAPQPPAPAMDFLDTEGLSEREIELRRKRMQGAQGAPSRTPSPSPSPSTPPRGL